MLLNSIIDTVEILVPLDSVPSSFSTMLVGIRSIVIIVMTTVVVRIVEWRRLIVLVEIARITR